MDVYTNVKKLLDEKNVEYKTMHHEPTPTSKDSARVRDDPLSQGVKALLLKVGDKFQMVAIRAHLKLDSKKMKKEFQTKKVRFATPEELLQITTLKPGSVPPFGRPIFDVELYTDTSIKDFKLVSFNAGRVTDSVTMKTKDYLEVAQPRIIEIRTV